MYGKRRLLVLDERQKEYRIAYQSGKVLLATYYDLPFEKMLLANERLTPPIEEHTLLQSELEARVKTLLAGMALCDLLFEEHTSDAQKDLLDAKEIVVAMVERYGMGEEILAKETEAAQTLQSLYEETLVLLKTMLEAAKRVRAILKEKESITKQEVKEIFDAVL